MIARVLAVLGDQAECGADACPWQIVDHRHLEDGKPISLEIRRYGLQPAGADELGIVGRTKPAAMVDRDIPGLRLRPAKQRLAPAAQLDAGGERIAAIAPSSSNLTKRGRGDQ